MASKPTWMIYGANGYTGKLIAQYAHKIGMRPILAGRTKEKVGLGILTGRIISAPLAAEYGFEYKVFPCDEGHAADMDANLKDIDVLVQCAGPFKYTVRPFIESCIRTKTHYFDITGEIEVFEYIFTKDKEAKEAGVALIPGIGFDVVPTDCLARMLKDKLPDATHLQLAFWNYGGSTSPGTSKTSLEAFSTGGGRVRKNGEIVVEPMFAQETDVQFSTDHKHVASIPWGDVSTAYHSTGIKNIVVYVEMPASSIAWARGHIFRAVQWLSGWSLVRWGVEKLIEKFVHGPTDDTRKTAQTEVWGRAYNSETKEAVVGCLTTPEGYTFTAYSALAGVKRILNGTALRGALTPSLAFGPDFVKEVFSEGDEWKVVVHEFTHTRL